jgi:hypothetical protein
MTITLVASYKLAGNLHSLSVLEANTVNGPIALVSKRLRLPKNLQKQIWGQSPKPMWKNNKITF